MRKTLLISAALVLLASPAMAFGNKTTNHGGDASASSSAAAAASAGAHSSSGVYGSGNSRNHNSNRAYGGNAHQGQAQGQIQGQQQRNRVNNSDSVTVEGDDVDQEYYNVNTPSSAGNNVWDCTQAYNGSLNILFGGFSFGVPQSDEVCEATKLLSLAQITQDAVLIEMAKRRIQDILQDRIGYNATVNLIQTKAAPQTSRVHKSRPGWCPMEDIRFGMSEADKKACGLI